MFRRIFIEPKASMAATALAVWVLVAAGIPALSTPLQDPSTDDLIEQLSDGDIARRDAAQQQLQEKGEKLADKGLDDPQYQEFKEKLGAASGSTDAEVASRAKKIIEDVEDYPEVKERMQEWRQDNGDPKTPEEADKLLKKLQRSLEEALQSQQELQADLAEAQADGRILDELDLADRLRRTRRQIKAYDRLKVSIEKQKVQLQKVRIEREERRDGMKQFGMQSAPGFKLWGPSIAWDGETFTGLVTAETAEGSIPLAAGDQVIFSGEVVQTVKPDGTIEIPPRALAHDRDCLSNNVVYLAAVSTAFGKPVAPGQATVAGRVQLLPSTSADGKTNPATHDQRIARVSPIVTGEAPFSVFGQGLDRLTEAALLGEDGSAMTLGPSIGSALHRIYLPRGDARPAKGMLQFVAWDDAGRRLEAPQKTRNPHLKLEGTRITHKNQTGEIRVLSDTSGVVQLSGGDPQISVYQKPFPVVANVQKVAKFLSRDVGSYTVLGQIRSREDVPPRPDAKRASAQVEPLRYAYDVRNNVTRADVPVQVNDHMGNPVADTPVQMAVTIPHGIAYGVPMTDKLGRAVMKLELPGRVSASHIQPHIYGLPGLTWLPQDHCCDCKSVAYTDDPPIGNIAAEGFSTSDGADKLHALLKGSPEGRRIARSIDSQTTLAGWLRITYKLSPALAATQGDKGEIVITRSTSVAITAPNLSAWKILYRRGDLVQANEPPATGGDIVQQIKVKCPEEASFKGHDYEVWLGLLLEPGAAPPAQVTVRINDTFDKCPGGASTSTNVQLTWNTNLNPPKLLSAQ